MPPLKEKKKHLSAFEYWYNGGRIRPCSKVAIKFHICERTVWNWLKKYNWIQRSHDRTERMKEKLDERSAENIAERRAKYLQVAEASVALYVKNLKAGKVKIISTQDLDRLTRLVMFLSGEPESRISSEIKPDIQYLRDFLNQMGEKKKK